MVGPDPKAQGGIASVAAILRQACLFEDGQVLFLPSFRDGGVFFKLQTAACAWLSYVLVLMRGGGEILHVHAASQASFWRKAVFIWTAKAARRKVVFQLHSGGFRTFLESLSPPLRAFALATLHRVDLLLCLSTETETWLRTLTPDVPIRWWPNPIPDSLFGAFGSTDHSEPVLLYLGALAPAKGVSDLLLAFVQVHAFDPRARLVLGGTGKELDRLSDLANKFGLRDAVSFPGWLGDEAKREWLGRARVLALPSHVEAQPMVLLEAMAAGVAVVSTRVGGVPDLITDGEHGMLVPIGQPDQLAAALLRIWNDGALRSHMARLAKVRVEGRHRADRVCESMMTMYRELARQSR